MAKDAAIARRPWMLITLSVAFLAMLSAVPVSGQVKIEATPPAPDVKLRPGQPFLEPPPPELREDQRRPDLPFVPYEPAFIRVFSREFKTPSSATGRAGLSLWTAPGSALGASLAYRDVSGWMAAGLSIVWGGPPRTASDDAPAASISSERAPEPLRVGDFVRRRSVAARRVGRVLAFVDRSGISHAVVEWLGSEGSTPTYEPLARLEPVHSAARSR
jgi:hypothetical protein